MELGNHTVSFAKPVLNEIYQEIQRVKFVRSKTYEEQTTNGLAIQPERGWSDVPESTNIARNTDRQSSSRSVREDLESIMIEHQLQRLSELTVQGKTNEVIQRVDEEYESRKEVCIQELLKSRPMPETENPLERAHHLTQVTQIATELILEQVIQDIQ